MEHRKDLLKLTPQGGEEKMVRQMVTAVMGKQRPGEGNLTC